MVRIRLIRGSVGGAITYALVVCGCGDPTPRVLVAEPPPPAVAPPAPAPPGPSVEAVAPASSGPPTTQGLAAEAIPALHALSVRQVAVADRLRALDERLAALAGAEGVDRALRLKALQDEAAALHVEAQWLAAEAKELGHLGRAIETVHGRRR